MNQFDQWDVSDTMIGHWVPRFMLGGSQMADETRNISRGFSGSFLA